MSPIRLVRITENGTPAEDLGLLPEAAADVSASTAALYGSVGYQPPWTGYFALRGHELVGTCAFTRAPVNDRVEIAYFTFPGFEGQGIATAMAAALIAIARKAQPGVLIYAHTLPAPNTSNNILKRLGFLFAGTVPHEEEGSVWEWYLVPQS